MAKKKKKVVQKSEKKPFYIWVDEDLITWVDKAWKRLEYDSRSAFMRELLKDAKKHISLK